MSLIKATGHMYDWVTHMHTHLGGECPHMCSYCYVDHAVSGRPERYRGELRLIEDEFAVAYGKGRTIFLEHKNDLFANEVPVEWIERVIGHTLSYPENQYVFQTKNPARYLDFSWRKPYLFGVTIETNKVHLASEVSQAPMVYDRFVAMVDFHRRKFVTIEPILDFDPVVMVEWMREIGPEFVVIGADSKGHGLKEPEWKKVEELIEGITKAGIEIKSKNNLERLKK